MRDLQIYHSSFFLRFSSILVDYLFAQGGWTALHFAAYYGNLEVVKAILGCDRFIEINAKEKVRKNILFM
jgi:hypothetical protein